MKKFAATVAVALLALFGFAALAPSAQAYPFPPPKVTFTLSPPSLTVTSGHSFVLHAKASVNCTSIKVTWDGQSVSGSGKTLNAKFIAPIVTSKTVIRAHATCTYVSARGTAGNAIAVSSPATATAHSDVTVLPVSSKGNGQNGHLPNTGGPSIGWLIGGILALLAGAGAMYAGRRRDTGAAAH